MIVPTNVTPINYLKKTNEFVFITARYVLRINFEVQYFELQLPNNVIIRHDFEFIKSPTEEFETIDIGIAEWVEAAIKWNESAIQPKGSKSFAFEMYEIQYTGVFNLQTNEIKIVIPGRTITCKREALATDYPEIQFVEFGQLITEITTQVVRKVRKAKNKIADNSEVSLPNEFKPESFMIGGNKFEFDYLEVCDSLLLVIPDREILANLLLLEMEVPEFTEMYDGAFCDVIRSVIYSED